MLFFNQKILDYCEEKTSKNNLILNELERETEYKVLMPRMLCGNQVGSILKLISELKKPKFILEIGTYTGYSAICLAQGLSNDGQLHTIEINEELKDLAIKYFKKSKLHEKIKIHTGNALDIIPSINLHFDIIFIDADKKNYCKYYDLAINKINKGGYIIIDNVLWSGKVITEISEKDVETIAISNLNKKIMLDKRVENMLLPIRDGLMICKAL
ncbi:MAG: methyltransferase [Flavobacteriales bacterium]|nr:methyltransferase [Flavobacteriales bacterium]|tara:strand:- start:18871 stop:19512 length:642 start_codon:yes stop_codon:yes gene_type:complete